jgi:hypothetical protein
MLQEILWKPHAYIYLPMSLTSAGSSSALLRFIGSVSNLSLFTIGGYYYYYSHNKMMERKMATGQSLIALFFLSVSIEDHPLLWMVVRSQIYYPEHILTYGSGKARYPLIVGFGSFWTD